MSKSNRREEWRAVGMDGPRFDRISGIYPDRETVEKIIAVRGGRIERRTVSEWAEVSR